MRAYVCVSTATLHLLVLVIAERLVAECSLLSQGKVC